MQLPLYQVDAFTDTLFKGNPAAVVPLNEWLPESIMQSIAAENNLAETVYIVPMGQDYEIRWFTPTVEVDLCGHATLASAWVLWNRMDNKMPVITFHSKSGPLYV
ncbi:MAG TPA: PhzF family phenazine biosynthesis isomerase, partial [Chitinophagaceae bacterium]|nr:PhzF family phenazine biosynthesis isomerase [Chitinophagaceae bacterium]